MSAVTEVELAGGGSDDDSAYLTIASAASTYLAQSDAASTYLTIATAAGTYATLDGLASYLTIASAASTYETQGHAAATYETIAAAAAFETSAHASATYETIAAAAAFETSAHAASTYLTISTAASTYLTQSNAAATYLTIATAASTYWPIPSLTNKDVLYATGAATVGQSANFQWDNTAHTVTIVGSGGETTAPLVITTGNSAARGISLTGGASTIDCNGDFILAGNTTTSLSVATQGIVLQMSSADDAIGLKQSAFKGDGTQVVALGAFGPSSLTSLTPSKWLPFKDRVGGTTYLVAAYASSL